MQSTYLDFEAKYLRGINLEEICQNMPVRIIENRDKGYGRFSISAEAGPEKINILLEELLFRQSENWCLEKYMQPYRFLLTTDYYRKMEERVLKFYKQEEKIIRRRLLKELGEEVKEKCQFNISGYLRFRAETWQKLVKNFLAEIYLALTEEIEQENFIALLQYFVRTQPIILDKVYLFLAKDGSFYLSDEYGHNLRDEYLQQVSPQEIADVSEIDLLLSILVTLLPKEIYLHSEQEMNFPPLKLLQQVFGERIISW